MTPIDDWLQQQADRTMANQRAQADTAKLLSTFTVAIAATFVVTALQVGPITGSDVWATWILAACFAAAIAVLLLDRITDVDIEDAFRLSHANGWTEEELLRHLRTETIRAQALNASFVSRIWTGVAVQLALAVAAGSVAAVSLLAVGS